MSIIIEEITRQHNRKGFDSGVTELNLFLQQTKRRIAQLETAKREYESKLQKMEGSEEKIKELNTKLQEANRLKRKFEEELSNHADVKLEKLNAMKLRTTISRLIKDIASTLKEAEEYLEYAEKEEISNQTDRCIKEFEKAIETVISWRKSKNGGVIDVEYSEVE